MSYILLTTIVATIIGVSPLLFKRRFAASAILGVVGFLIVWWIVYASTPSTVWPLFGLPGLLVAILWLVAAFIDTGMTSDRYGDHSVSWLFVFPVLYLVLLIGSGLLGSSIFNAGTYASMIGEVEERDWTQDIQPKDPKHMRMVSGENALYIAQKAVANAGAIGSQFRLDTDHMTLQRVKDELVYVIPFDFSGFSVWLNTEGSPAYVVIDAEDPERMPRLVQLPKGGSMRYMPGAFFSKNLERHMRNKGFVGDGLIEPRFELDENEKPHWVVSTFDPTVWWSGKKVTGMAVIDPVTGEIERHSMEEVPDWVDRVIPSNYVEQYIDWHGRYSNGWLNSWWGKAELTEAEFPILIYSSNHRAEWVTGVTSTNLADDSLIGLMYTDSRTGKSVYYKTNGGATDTAIMQAVNTNQQVQYKHLHSTTPQIYNVYGTMASVVPLLNDNHAFQGVAVVSVVNPQDVAVGSTQSEALRAYQSLIFRHGQQVAFESEHAIKELTGVVDRINQDMGSGNNVYLMHVQGVPRIFTGSSGEHVKLALTQPGDTVTITFIASGEDVVPMNKFDNLSLPLEKTKQQQEVELAAFAKHESDAVRVSAADLVKRINTMSPEELRKLEEALER